jgi:hypothetical protein
VIDEMSIEDTRLAKFESSEMRKVRAQKSEYKSQKDRKLKRPKYPKKFKSLINEKLKSSKSQKNLQ